ncbi:hypothetical protein HD806DRAFT_487990 [Xylariaceae sp. AK1471]|nr:hypothetical protein HD806DRAFT_487990 [Xylariaceae sp. AK1471]
MHLMVLTACTQPLESIQGSKAYICIFTLDVSSETEAVPRQYRGTYAYTKYDRPSTLYIPGAVGRTFMLTTLAPLGFCAFTHKAGIHAKAIPANPSTYEILSPEDYGLNRYVHFASRSTGWNAIKSRVEQLSLSISDAQVKEVIAKIKQMADIRPSLLTIRIQSSARST